ncbi:MAG: glycoside hydrolase family 2 protein [Ferruginibacter sp.]
MRLLFSILFLPFFAAAQNISVSLNSNWQFRQAGKKTWNNATVPGTTHTDLLANKLIPDPYFRDNENKLQWVDKTDWDYKKNFNVDSFTFSKKNIELVFDGLDTYADVFLNGKLILQAENMFRQYIVPVKLLLKKNNNELFIHFSSAKNKVDSIAKSRLPLVLPDNNRVYVRKAQYHFGWDWGPKFVGCGIWKAVNIQGWDDFIIKGQQCIFLRQSHDTSFYKVKLKIFAATKTKAALIMNRLTESGGYSIFPPFSAIDSNFGQKTGTDLVTAALDLKKGFNDIVVYPKISTSVIWNPDVSRNVYSMTCTIFNNTNYASTVFQTAARKVELVQQRDSIGTSFYFKINGQPVFMKGANYIPSDVFLPTVKKEDYRKILQSAKDANMNMLRVWGGGVYEADEFYDLCDSMGIMVWQDLMFAGGMYPADEHFTNNVHEEIKYQIERLRNHPCIVLWCGNNEIDEAWHNWGWQEQFNLHGNDSAKIWNDYKKLFEDSLKQWVTEYDGTRPYISSSPKNGWGHKESLTEGDSHYWGLWWGLEDWEVFETKTGRFVSEYGMQSMPDMNTIKKFTDDSDRYLYSPVIQSHQKANEGFNKLNYYLNKYFIDSSRLATKALTSKANNVQSGLTINFEDYIYLTQCLQYYILKNSIAIHRSKQPNTMGTLLWQLNDCWPVASWSITDYSRAPKAAWYAVKEAYRDDVLPVRDSIYPKDLKLKQPVFTIQISGDEISISSDVFSKYVYLDAGQTGYTFSDNYFDLQPGETKIIKYNKIIAREEVAGNINIKIKSLYDVINK